MTFKLPTIHYPASDALSLLIRYGEHRYYETLYQYKYAEMISFQLRYQQTLNKYTDAPEKQNDEHLAITANKPGGRAQKCFRELARKLHPDRLQKQNLSDAEYRKRYSLLQKASSLYQKEDTRGLELLLLSLSNHRSNQELRAAKIAFLEAQIYDLAQKIGLLERSKMWRLYLAEQSLAEQGRNLLAELEQALKHQGKFQTHQ
ncbi:MAG: hypothetical protein CMK59_09140 [Proteobacteria bacterium]|nr:hypothetical protein [Pseudomonadota bacterium]